MEITESSCAPFIRHIEFQCGTALYVVRYEHANDYEGAIVACLEYSEALELCTKLRTEATGTQIFDTCEA